MWCVQAKNTNGEWVTVESNLTCKEAHRIVCEIDNGTDDLRAVPQ